MSKLQKTSSNVEEYLIKDNIQKVYEKIETFLNNESLTKGLYHALSTELTTSKDVGKTYSDLILKMEQRKEKQPYLIIDESFPMMGFKRRFEQSEDPNKWEIVNFCLYVLLYGIYALSVLNHWLVDYRTGKTENKTRIELYQMYNDNLDMTIYKHSLFIRFYSREGSPKLVASSQDITHEVSKEDKLFMGHQEITNEFAKRIKSITKWQGVRSYLRRKGVKPQHHPDTGKPFFTEKEIDDLIGKI